MVHAGELVSKADFDRAYLSAGFGCVIQMCLRCLSVALRKKLDADGDLKPIETVRGRGYRFAIARNEN